MSISRKKADLTALLEKGKGPEINEMAREGGFYMAYMNLLASMGKKGARIVFEDMGRQNLIHKLFKDAIHELAFMRFFISGDIDEYAFLYREAFLLQGELDRQREQEMKKRIDSIFKGNDIMNPWVIAAIGSAHHEMREAYDNGQYLMDVWRSTSQESLLKVNVYIRSLDMSSIQSEKVWRFTMLNFLEERIFFGSDTESLEARSEFLQKLLFEKMTAQEIREMIGYAIRKSFDSDKEGVERFNIEKFRWGIKNWLEENKLTDEELKDFSRIFSGDKSAGKGVAPLFAAIWSDLIKNSGGIISGNREGKLIISDGLDDADGRVEEFRKDAEILYVDILKEESGKIGLSEDGLRKRIAEHMAQIGPGKKEVDLTEDIAGHYGEALDQMRYGRYAKEHVGRVLSLALRIGKGLGLDETRLNWLVKTVIYHHAGVDVQDQYRDTFNEFKGIIRAELEKRGIAAKPAAKQNAEILIELLRREQVLSAEDDRSDFEKKCDLLEKVFTSALNKGLEPYEILMVKTFVDIPHLTLDVLRDRGIELPFEVAVLIKYYDDHRAFLDEYDTFSGRAGCAKSDLSELIAILYIADIFETGNNADVKTQEKRGKLFESFPDAISFIEKRMSDDSLTDVDSLKVLKGLIGDADQKLFETIFDARKTRELTPLDQEYIIRQKEPERAQAFIDTVLIRAHEAKKSNQDIIIGIETSWIPEVQMPYMQGLLNKLNNMSQERGLDNIIIRCRKGPGLADVLSREAERRVTPNGNIIILGADKVLDDKSFDALREGADPEKRAFFAGVELPENFPENNYIRLLEMLTKAMDLWSGKAGPSETEFLRIVQDGKRIFRFIIPEIEPVEYELLRAAYNSQLKVLKAA